MRRTVGSFARRLVVGLILIITVAVADLGPTAPALAQDKPATALAGETDTAPVASSSPRVTVVLVQGDVVAGVISGTSADKEQLVVASRSLGAVSLSLDNVLRIFVDEAQALAVLPSENTTRDQVYFRDASGPIEGILDAVTPSGVAIDAGKALGVLDFSWSRIAVVVVGDPTHGPLPRPTRAIVQVHCRDGSISTGELVRQNADGVELRGTLLGPGLVKIAADQVEQVLELAN